MCYLGFTSQQIDRLTSISLAGGCLRSACLTRVNIFTSVFTQAHWFREIKRNSFKNSRFNLCCVCRFKRVTWSATQNVWRFVIISMTDILLLKYNALLVIDKNLNGCLSCVEEFPICEKITQVFGMTILA